MLNSNLIKQRYLIVGSNGMLGQRLVKLYSNDNLVELSTCSAEEISYNDNVDYKAVDITDREQVKKITYDFTPDVIINSAAFTNVDLCETQRETAWKANVKAVEYLAECARVIDAKIVHISTDYVFDGKNGPYSEKDNPNPISYYGRGKLASENALRISGVSYLIFRTNVLYGPVRKGRHDFVRWVYDSLKNGKTINIVTDQINNPTYIDDLARGIKKALDFKKEGVYHTGGLEFISRFDFTVRIAEYFGLNKRLINPILTSDLNQPAKRPLKSGLITIKAQSEFGYSAASLEESLLKMKEELNLN